MADIKQAAIWMRNGNSVRRSVWTSFIPPMYCDEFGELAFRGVVDKPTIEIIELLAEDWELAQ